MLSKSILSSNHLCIFLARATCCAMMTLHPLTLKRRATSTQPRYVLCDMPKRDHIPSKCRATSLPDYLVNARDHSSAGAGYQLLIATGQCYTTRPGIVTSGEEAPTAKNLRSRGITQTRSSNVSFGPVKGILISQVQGEHGIDVCVPSSSSTGPNENTMAWVTICRARQTIKVFSDEVLQTPPLGPRSD